MIDIDDPTRPKEADAKGTPELPVQTAEPGADKPSEADAMAGDVHGAVQAVTDQVEFCGSLVPQDLVEKWKVFLGNFFVREAWHNYKKEPRQYRLEQTDAGQVLVLEGNIRWDEITALPPNIRILGDLNLTTLYEGILPEGLVVDGDVTIELYLLEDCKFPDKFNIGGRLIFNKRGSIDITWCLKHFETLKDLAKSGKVKRGIFINGFKITANATVENLIAEQVKTKAIPGLRAGRRRPYYPQAEHLLGHLDDFRNLKNFDELVDFARKVKRPERRFA